MANGFKTLIISQHIKLKQMDKKIVYGARGFYGELGEFYIDINEDEGHDPSCLGDNEFYTLEEAEAYVIDEYKGIINYYQNLINKLLIKN